MGHYKRMIQILFVENGRVIEEGTFAILKEESKDLDPEILGLECFDDLHDHVFTRAQLDEDETQKDIGEVISRNISFLIDDQIDGTKASHGPTMEEWAKEDRLGIKQDL